MTCPRTQRSLHWNSASSMMAACKSPVTSDSISCSVHCMAQSGVTSSWNSTKIGELLWPLQRLRLRPPARLQMVLVPVQVEEALARSRLSPSWSQTLIGPLSSKIPLLRWLHWSRSLGVIWPRWPGLGQQLLSTWPQGPSSTLLQRTPSMWSAPRAPLFRMGQARGLLVTKPQNSIRTVQTVAFHASWKQIVSRVSLRRWVPKMSIVLIKTWSNKMKGQKIIPHMIIFYISPPYPSQENGCDLPVQTLRDVLQHIESKGCVDFSLGGHTCARPPEVQQGKAPDSFVITPDPGNPLLWRPQLIQQKNLKPANIASHFQYSILKDSPLVLVPWFHNNSICFWFVPNMLSRKPRYYPTT